jgi:ribosomal protein S18 acetylase RimI-like enzyme
VIAVEQRELSRSETSLRKAVSSDVSPIAEALARAMEQDPGICWMFPRSQTRERVLPQVFAAMIAHLYLPANEVYTTDDRAAAALWLPPGHDAPAISQVISLAARMAPLFPRVGRALWRAPGLAGLLNARRPREPHYYLALLGVAPSRQGHGIGSAMLLSQLTRCDAEGCPAYLESSNRRNLDLYTRHRFEVTKELRLTRNGPTTWLMWREPK